MNMFSPKVSFLKKTTHSIVTESSKRQCGDINVDARNLILFLFVR